MSAAAPGVPTAASTAYRPTQSEKIDALVARLGGAPSGELQVGEVTVSQLAQRFGTPFYVYSGDVALEQVARVRRALGPEIDLYFSVKANPSLGICQLLARSGIGAEVASGGELALASRAGFSGERILFAGPGKTDRELALAATTGIQAINVESAGELERLAAMARRTGRRMDVGLRVNPSASLAGANMRMGGGSQQFGIDEEDVPALVERYREHDVVRIVGLHVYTGTQVFDVDRLLAQWDATLTLAATLAQLLGHPFAFVDLGGGFGVPYFENTPELDLDVLGEEGRALVTRASRDARFAGTRFLVELGRYLLAPAGVYVTRVVDVKSSRGKAYAVSDGGMNHHTMATGNFGQVFRKPYPVAVANRLNEARDRRTSVVGPCCTPLDVLGQDLELPEARVGDLVGVFYSGAYGYSASSLAFLSHPTPAEILVWRGGTYALRRGGDIDQVLSGQAGLPDADLEYGIVR